MLDGETWPWSLVFSPVGWAVVWSAGVDEPGVGAGSAATWAPVTVGAGSGAGTGASSGLGSGASAGGDANAILGAGVGVGVDMGASAGPGDVCCC